MSILRNEFVHMQMRFASLTFRIAGIWGLVVIVPMYFLFDAIGRQNPPAMNHPQFYFGFLGVTLVWQLLFLTISKDPARYRPLFPAALLEKLVFIVTMMVLAIAGQIRVADAMVAVPDSVLAVFFVMAMLRTDRSRPAKRGTGATDDPALTSYPTGDGAWRTQDSI